MKEVDKKSRYLRLDLFEPKKRNLGHSQKGQDSLIQRVFDIVGTTDKYYVEFGAYDGVQMCNTWYFKNKKGWSGLLLDNMYENLEINLHKRHITKENICDIFAEFKVPKQHDFLCVDIDGCDYWILKEILLQYSPRVIMVETAVRFEPYESVALKYDPNWSWNGRDWYGASPYAFKKMFDKYNYVPIYIHEDDMFAVRRDVLTDHGFDEPPWSYVYSGPREELYENLQGHAPDHPRYDGQPSRHISSPNKEQWQEV